MARTRAPGRLDGIADAALVVFCARGLINARMSDVAELAGVSQGLLYTYVESKEALAHHVVERVIAGGPVDASLPIPTPAPGATRRLIAKALAEGFALPTLHAALTAPRPRRPREELETVLRELYRAISRWRHLVMILERTAADVEDLRDRFYGRGRRPLVTDIARYLGARIAEGALRQVPDPAVAARVILETSMWFASHRHNDPDSADISDAMAEETVVDMLTAALVR